jgi:Phage integrase, N-terminal SAM-like domain
MDPEAGKVTFGEYASSWMREHVLKPRTADLYASLLKNHVAPTFGSIDLGDIHEADIRRAEGTP